MQPSPYTPGEIARQIPGRAVQLAQMDERLSYLVDLRRLVGRIRVDVAARGIGKTSLLREVQRRAEARGVLTVWVTAGEQHGLIAALADQVRRATAQWRSELRKDLRAGLERLRVSVGVPGIARVEADWSADAAPPARGVREFEDVLRTTVAGALNENYTGVVLFVDEIQAADAEGLRTLAYAWQHLQSEGSDVPAAVFAAGLPSSPEVIAEVVTFSERFAYRTLGRLTDDAVMIALSAPARALGIEWDHDALDAAVAQAQGYPYTVQLIGDATWEAAGRPDPGARLSAADLARGEQAVRADLDAMFRARWEKASPGEQHLMYAMAEFGDGPVRRAEIARVMHLTSDELSVPRARLIDKGLVQVAGRGELEFTIPGFAAYVRERR